MPRTDFLERLLYHDETLDSLKAGDVSGERLQTIRQASANDLIGTDEYPERAELVRAALFYFANSLDEAHRVVADVSGDLPAYLHGMIHRREEDFDNARYWFSRAGMLPFFGELHRVGGQISEDIARQLSWDPYLFSTLCERFKYGARHSLKVLTGLQKAEFTVYLEYVMRAG